MKPALLLLLSWTWPSLSTSSTAPKEKLTCPLLEGVHTTVMRRIFNAGFHKDLVTEIELMLTTTLLPPSCRLVVEETIPKGMYVDTDELRDMFDNTGLKTLVSANVNVESPEFESEAFRVFVFRSLSVKENLRVTNVNIPVHIRYHRPRETEEGADPRTKAEHPSAVVRLQNPRLLLSCEDDHLPDVCPQRSVTSFCDASGTTKCEYLVLPYSVNVKAVEISVPVGDKDQAPTVVGGTTFVVFAATIYLLVALFRKMDDPKEQT